MEACAPRVIMSPEMCWDPAYALERCNEMRGKWTTRICLGMNKRRGEVHGPWFGLIGGLSLLRDFFVHSNSFSDARSMSPRTFTQSSTISGTPLSLHIPLPFVFRMPPSLNQINPHSLSTRITTRISFTFGFVSGPSSASRNLLGTSLLWCVSVLYAEVLLDNAHVPRVAPQFILSNCSSPFLIFSSLCLNQILHDETAILRRQRHYRLYCVRLPFTDEIHPDVQPTHYHCDKDSDRWRLDSMAFIRSP